MRQPFNSEPSNICVPLAQVYTKPNRAVNKTVYETTNRGYIKYALSKKNRRLWEIPLVVTLNIRSRTLSGLFLYKRYGGGGPLQKHSAIRAQLHCHHLSALPVSRFFTFFVSKLKSRRYNSQKYRSRSQWPRGLRRGSAADRLLGLWARIPPGGHGRMLWVLCVVVR